jgi:diguanylate cyclase (GGDEF)-like protein
MYRLDWQFDIRTGVIVCAVLALLVDGLLLAVYRSLPAHYRPSLRWWLVGGVLHPLGFLLMGLRDMIPDWISIIVANALLAIALSCTAIALRMFYQVEQRRLRLFLTTAIIVAIAWWFSQEQPSQHWRTALLPLLLAVLVGSSARAIFRRGGPRGLIPGLAGGVFALGTLMLVYRGVDELLRPTALIFESTLSHVLAFGVIGLLPVLSTICFLLLCTDDCQRELQRAARVDFLTGVCNRRAIDDLAQRTIAAARRHGMPLSIMIIDVDHFKRINDAHGHQAGDVALVETVRRIRDSLRAEDLVGRLGGEEFVVVMPNTDGDSAIAAAERIRAAFASLPMQIGGSAMSITVSVGVSLLAPGDSLFSHLLRRADHAMYAAKAAGRDRVMVDAGGPAPA